MNSLTNTVVPSKNSQTLPQPSGTFQSNSQNIAEPFQTSNTSSKGLRNGTSKPFNRRIVRPFGLSETFHVHDLPNRKKNLEKLATQRLTFNGTLPFRQANLTSKQGTPKAYHGHRQPNATPALWRSMLRRLYHALDGSSSQAYSALASFNACFHVHDVHGSAFSYIGMSVVNECILEDIHMNTRITIELNAYMFYHVPKHKTPKTTQYNKTQYKITQRNATRNNTRYYNDR